MGDALTSDISDIEPWNIIYIQLMFKCIRGIVMDIFPICVHWEKYQCIKVVRKGCVDQSDP